ncbi:MAG: TerB family tellurite resistance protein [Alphaproteobacteria bacterium]|nr:TerB family tellurite resistance protein [Alphaproteobacteria bacterium]MCZ6764703.1 TerB family tellurite resistance protein [Alphaproteobacteria bacterium]
MSILGKIIGGTAGLALGGPLGALLGLVAGHAIDTVRDERAGAKPPDKQVAFTIAVIALGAKLAKADGMVTEDEIRAFRKVFRVPPDEVRNVGRVFNLARRHTHGYEPYARQIAGMFHGQPTVLEDLLWCLFTIAQADGEVSGEEIAYLTNVAVIFGFSDDDFARIRAEFTGPDAADPYQILGVARDADDKTIKAQHRKLVRENHPDRMIAQGLPEEFVSVANEKLAAINAAYDKIRELRGI